MKNEIDIKQILEENKRLKRYINQLEKDQDTLKNSIKFLTTNK